VKGFPAAHRAKLHSTTPLERFNGEIVRRTEVVGIVPDEPSIRRLIGAIPLEQTTSGPCSAAAP
jgi:transposase-like protein